MKCAYCGRSKGLFEKFAKYDFCEDCNTEVRARLKSMLEGLDNFITAYPTASVGVKKSVLLDQLTEQLAIIDELETMRPKAPMFKSSTDPQLKKLLDWKCALLGKYSDTLKIDVPGKIGDAQLAYQYRGVELACVALFSPDFSGIRLCDEVQFSQEPENEHDKKCVAVYLGDKKLGYLYRGQVQDIVNDWLRRGDPIFAAISSFNHENNQISVFVGLYLNRIAKLQACKSIETRLIKSDEGRQEMISFTSEGAQLDLMYDDFEETYLVTDDTGNELGEVSKSVSHKLHEKESEYELLAFASEIVDDEDETHLKIKVFFKP